MPITALYLISDPPPTTPPLFLERLHKRPTPPQSWRIEHRLLRSSSSNQFLQILDIPHLRSSFACISPPGSIITVSPDFVALLKSKLSTLWTQRPSLTVSGQTWDDGGEWRVRVGRVSTRGESTIVEVEYAGAEYVVREVVEEYGKNKLGLEGGKWFWGEEGEKWGPLQAGKLWADLLRSR